MKAAIQQRAAELGFDGCRFTTADPPDHKEHFERWLQSGCHGEMGYLQRNAHKRVDPQQVLAEARTIITLAASYAGNAEGPIARYARFTDYHDVLAAPLEKLTKFVNSFGAHSLWYVDTGPLLERDLAQRAGLGFVGKHTNLISRELGNWFFLAEIITTLDIEPDAAEQNRCGKCTRCIDVCPTAAITAPHHLDARRCISYLTIERRGPLDDAEQAMLGEWVFGCDVCQDVCPWNVKFAQPTSDTKLAPRPELSAPSLDELGSCDDAEFTSRFGDTPLARAGAGGMRRNVAAVSNAHE